MNEKRSTYREHVDENAMIKNLYPAPNTKRERNKYN